MNDARRIIVVTGVTRGLGRALVEGFAARGHRVWGCARSTEGISALRQRLGEPHDFAPVDVADDGAVARWAEERLAQGGAPDLVINNAGLMHENAPLWRIPDEALARVLDVNVRGTASVARHFLPSMIDAGRGVLVNVSSGWGRSVSAEVSGYCASKWAVEGLTRALAEELPPGLAAVAVNPGVIDTDMLRSCFGAGAEHYPQAPAWAERAVPFLLALGPEDNGSSVTVA